MATVSVSCLLSEDQLMCSVCLDVFTQPVTTPCGHTFCKTCITNYWSNRPLVCHCPLCNQGFDSRPAIFVNVVILELTAQFRKSVEKETISSPSQRPAEPGEVSCDACDGRKRKAMKSCLGCLASYCESHLEPHSIAVALKRHKLIDPVENLEDRVCKKHKRPLELFCRTDQTCVCHFCLEKTHEAHDTVPLEREYKERKDQMMKDMTALQQMIQERVLKVQQIKQSARISKEQAKHEIADSTEVFTALVASVKRSQAELIELIEEKQISAEKQAVGFTKDLEQEITVLKRRSTELEQLSQTEDHLHLIQGLQGLPTMSCTKDWSQISIYSDVGMTVRTAVVQLEKTLREEMEKLPEVKLMRIQQCAVDGKQGIISGTFYNEVQVTGKTKWFFGVIRKSIKTNVIECSEDEKWGIMCNGENYRALTCVPVVLSLRAKPEKIGLFVDYEKGDISFYDVEARALIYSFTGCTFTQKLYPVFKTYKPIQQ